MVKIFNFYRKATFVKKRNKSRKNQFLPLVNYQNDKMFL